jgi:hypothetical protein
MFSVCLRVTGAVYTEHLKETVKQKGCLPQQILSLYETGLKFEYEAEAVMALYSKVYRDMQEPKQRIISFVTESSVSLSALFVI